MPVPKMSAPPPDYTVNPAPPLAAEPGSLAGAPFRVVSDFKIGRAHV